MFLSYIGVLDLGLGTVVISVSVTAIFISVTFNCPSFQL